MTGGGPPRAADDGIARFTWLIPFLGVLTTLGPLSNDLYVPSLTLVAAGLGAGGGAVQLTMSSLLLGFSVGALLYGPLSDRYGRKPVLCAGLVVYVLAASLSALSADLGQLIAARTLQGFGAASAMVLARAIILDRWRGEQASRAMSWVSIFTFLTPVIAPLVGGWIASFRHWPAVFWVQAAAGLTFAVVTALALPRTHRAGGGSLRASLASYGLILRDAQALGYMALTGFGFIGVIAFVSNSAFVLIENFGLGPAQYGAAFSFVMLGASAGAWLNGRLVTRVGISRLIGAGTVILGSGGVLTLAVVLGGFGLVAIVGAVSVYVFGIGFVFANAVARTMSRFRDRAGAASSLFAVNQFLAGGLVAAALSLSETPTPLPLAATIAAAGAGCVVIWWAWLRRIPNVREIS